VLTPFVPAKPVYSFFRSCCRILTTVMFDLKVYGLEHIPTTGGVLLLANHCSYLDPPLLGTQLRRPASFLARSGLFEIPVFGQVIPRLNAFPVRQGAGDVGAVRETIRRLHEGHVLTIFPEGGRSEDGELQPLAGGFTLIVRKADVPVIPVGIDGAFRAWPRGRALPQCAPVRVKFGPPMNIAGLKPAAIVPKVESELRRLIGELRAMRRFEEA
jgi:1-acyl-sn-glycerol-3-phosphate acyltransferase